MANGEKSLINTATRHQIVLEGYKSHAADVFQLKFDEVAAATNKTIIEMGVQNISEVSRTALVSKLSALKQKNISILNEAMGSLFKDLDKLADSEAAFEVKSFQSIKASVRLKVPKAGLAFEDALARPLSVDGSMLESFISGWGKAESLRVNNTIAKAWSEGWSVGKLTSAINGTKKLNYKDGIIGPPNTSASVARRNAQAVARTAVQHVSSSARMLTWEKNADVIMGYKFIATLDSRTTQQCRSLDGKTFELNLGPVPPVHVNCRSTTVATLPSEFDFLDEGATRSSDVGQVPANQNYYDWLKDQPEEFQDHALGKTRAKLFRDGGLSVDEFASLNIGRTFKPLTLEQMQKINPIAFSKAGITD